MKKLWSKSILCSLAFAIGISGFAGVANAESNYKEVVKGKYYFDTYFKKKYSYKLGTKINANINKQVMDVTKTLLKDKKRYTETKHLKADKYFKSRVITSFAQSEPFVESGEFAFRYRFYDQKYYTSKVHTVLEINTLWMNDVSEIKKDYAETIYKSALQNSLEAAYGKTNGNAINKYVFDIYLKKKQKKITSKSKGSKTFKNLKVNYYIEDDHVNYAFFYLKGNK
ncbi:hypothetical protein LCY76_22830 [Fictibacillus sp. KIGAM418]|uniref:Deacetylase PdaC domain-containing protein n=1 Tax=Fictibacillus marinisediminis TaxID=2878389 RepID=A0A9X1XFX4_9BACL|nr:hypothetical protein [Fictibacillus marinisediminis]MCK6259411.1 hypothetical protein [Fictibacillus marinisediminis]